MQGGWTTRLVEALSRLQAMENAMALKMALSSVKAVICAPLAGARPRMTAARSAHAKTAWVVAQGQLPVIRAIRMPLFPLMSRTLMLSAASAAAEPLSPEYEAYVQGDEDLMELSPCAWPPCFRITYYCTFSPIQYGPNLPGPSHICRVQISDSDPSTCRVS